MKSIKLWHIAAAFFGLCVIINLYGCLAGSDIKSLVKPALMPLLCLATMTFLAERTSLDAKEVKLLAFAQLFGFAGDTALIKDGFLFFAAGIGLFLIGHIFYISFFGGRSWKGLKLWHWIVALAVCAGLVAGLVAVIGVKGALLPPMAIYGFVLTLLMFSTLAGLIRFGGTSWLLLFIGSVLFTFSDALIAVSTFNQTSAFVSGFGVMSTYLIAQVLLAIGGTRLILKK